MKPLTHALAGALLACAGAAHAQDATLLIDEHFDGTGLPSGWIVGNFSDDPASEGWFRPTGTDPTFAAADGADDSYIATSVFAGATDAAGEPTGYVETMLATPTFSMAEDVVLRFATRTVADNAFGDSLHVGAFVSGSFVELTTLNPSFTVGLYPETWTTYEVRLAAQGDGITGRFFFEYTVDDAALYGNFVGIDAVSVAVSPVPEPSTAMLTLGGVAAFAAFGLGRRLRHDTTSGSLA